MYTCLGIYVCAGPDHRDDAPIWELLPAVEFYTFAVPFQMEGPTKVEVFYILYMTLSALLSAAWIHVIGLSGLVGRCLPQGLGICEHLCVCVCVCVCVCARACA